MKMDLERLKRHVLSVVEVELAGGTHTDITQKLKELDLPIDLSGSKRERIERVLVGISDEIVPDLARRLLETIRLRPADRNAIQDSIWTDSGYPSIPKRTRREIAEAIDIDDLYIDAHKFDDLLSNLWVLSNESDWIFFGDFAENDKGLRAQIDRHIHRFKGDWSALELFDKLGAFEASDRRFALFLEGLASPDVRPNEEAQRRFVGVVNVALKLQGLELRETGLDGGYPLFELVHIHSSPRGRPKNLIFASSKKPDMRFSDAIDNDIEIVSGKESVLVYDKAIGRDGLRWSDLQAWWKERQNIEDDVVAKRTLYLRLRSSLPNSSPPQRNLFDGFYKAFAHEAPQLPVLLPEVWLHWDPRTIRLRGRDALLNSRMDFLLLLPGNVRIVIEVDGQSHYADERGRANPELYARTAAADRELRLAGYEVYRFGAAELQQRDAREIVGAFFVSLFRLHGIRN
jgi:very-short-patch-repair endonuclease